MHTPAGLIAILGGGQLGRMIGLAGLPLGFDFRFLDPSPGPPAAAVGDCLTGSFDDPDLLDALVDGATVVTYEWEGVPAAAAERVAAHASLRPGIAALATSQDRLIEKTCFTDLEIPTASFVAVDSRADLAAAFATIAGPAILKTRTGGYDGKGQVRIDNDRELDAAWDAIAGAPAILEAVVPFTREISVIAARSTTGERRVFPIAENTHVGGILRTSIAPAPELDADRVSAATDYVQRLIDHLDYVGVIALECFETPNGILANEFAPRVHNSGHWTIEGATTSQFEQHVRAITGLPLGPTEALGVSAMCNCIGVLPDPAAVLAIPGAHLHDYRKAPRRGRKVGHVTITAPDMASCTERLRALGNVLPSDG